MRNVTGDGVVDPTLPGSLLAKMDEAERMLLAACTPSALRVALEAADEALRAAAGYRATERIKALLAMPRRGFPLLEVAEGAHADATRSAAAVAKSGGYDPGEPRVPAGQPGGGQWTTGGDGEGASAGSNDPSGDGDQGSDKSGASDVDAGAVTQSAGMPTSAASDPPVAAAPDPPLDPRALAAGVSPTPPDIKRQVNPQDDWTAFNNAVANLPGITPNEQFAYSEIFAAEGGLRTDQSSDASSGITPATLLNAQAALSGQNPPAILQGLDIANVAQPQDLTPEQRAAIYAWYINRAMSAVGASALGALDDPYTAAAVADTLFRNGSDGGSRLIQQAIDKVIAEIPSDQRAALGISGPIAKDGVFGSETFAALEALADAGYGTQFRDALANGREIVLKGEEPWRTDYFRYRGH